MVDKYANVPTILESVIPPSQPDHNNANHLSDGEGVQDNNAISTTTPPTVLPEDLPDKPWEPDPSPGPVEPELQKDPLFLRVVRWLAVFGLLMLTLVLAISECWRWSNWLRSQNLILLYVFWFAFACFLIGVLMLVGLQLRQYFRLRTIDVLKKALAEGPQTAPGLGDLTIRQEDDIQRKLYGYALMLRRSGSVCDAVWSKVESAITLDDWTDLLRIEILPSLDERALTIIERHVGAVAISTAISPSDIIDSFLVLWRNTKMLAEVAEVYGARPGFWGTARLARRVGTNVATAAVTQEAIHLLHVAYGPKIAEATGKTFEGLGSALTYVGGLASHSMPMIGLPIAGLGVVVNHVSRGTGQVAEVLSGPVVDALLTAVLTIRIGHEVQRQCRIIPMTAEEQACETAALGSVLQKIFAGFLWAAEKPSQIETEASPVPATVA